ncbi:nitrite reductase small subunit NirD [Dyadobacter sp. CY343]|uniref:nitrite reductase small subunit NirD n=1 Tax=Dyadobacter sp. CY343 TaxID=2907299 RepID=UPI001F468FD5|nr:nitrite reductase small subunit NirD [Dyadobacter sp. CY343]MCE7058609.1 nitrite reductase small subunit NirD [Dyadobacter sp. CY343]
MNTETQTPTDTQVTWHIACEVSDIPEDGGGCAFIDGKQIAIFNFARRGEWYATDNECPHRQQMAVSRGMIGSHEGEPKVACPFHKKTFSLKTGQCFNDDAYQIKTFPVMVRENLVYIGL